ncbi:CipC protein [Cunninghamella echinulata]|nr:CipC protein [Cunninghamella echinulata]
MSYSVEEYNRILDIEQPTEEHKASITHELLAGAAAFEAMRQINKHKEENGEEVTHSTAKELLAAFTGATVDRLVETKGLDFIDREKAKQ